jgi:18S rRNA (adenine1779-N6/adenine1780-N6)-dimethyltransferase
MLERNYRTWASLNNVPIEEGIVEDSSATPPADLDTMDVDADLDPEWAGLGNDAAFGAGVEADDDGAPDFFQSFAQHPDEKTKARRPRTKVAQLVYDKIVRVLEQTELADQRASKCDENDFLRLLHAFNAEGIHFA